MFSLNMTLAELDNIFNDSRVFVEGLDELSAERELDFGEVAPRKKNRHQKNFKKKAA